MTKLQDPDNGSPGGNATAEDRIVQQPGQFAEAMSLLRQEVRERKQAEERLRLSNEDLLLRLDELEQRDRDHLTLGKLSNYLKSCVSSDEAYSVITAFGPQIISSDAGTLYRINSPGGYLERVAGWGDITPEDKLFTVQDCWALRRGQLHWTHGARTGLLCQHISGPAESIFPYMCIPLVAHGETVGLLFLQRLGTTAQGGSIAPESKLQLASALGEEVSLALANLKLRDTLRQQSLRDPLTGLYNRRFLEEYLVHERVRATRKNRPLSVIMLDIDHFKRVNDTFGHDAGDAVLRRMGLVLQGHVRGSDIACRIGGEEFALLLPEASLVIAYQRAERILDTVRHMQIKHRGQTLGAITVSLGVAAFPKHGDTPEALIRAADQALYQAKQGGRNKLASA
ncbi:MAG TPA: sensor domain-containing diguanylate cyclase [Burkholderiales bacterium]|nr:sensor domain-containing diguanylate cyclase [Burkholderiales bacterium]